MAKKPSGLLDAVLASQPLKTGPKTWFGRMEEGDAKSQLRELHAAWHAGKLDRYSMTDLLKTTREVLGIEIGVSGFENWLKKADPDG